MNKIDVCIVTKNDRLPKGLEYLPVNKLIVSNKTPIGKAREDCIKQVTTNWFAFIDDDIEITREWFDICKLFEAPNVGAINGTDYYKGLGIFDRVIFNGSLIPKEVTYWGRMNGNNVLIRTELVKDWVARDNLICYEDLVLGRHIIDKGYKIILTPALCYHLKNWGTIKKSSIWAGKEFSKEHPDEIIPLYIIKKILEPIKGLIHRGILFSIYATYRNFWLIYGIVKGDKNND
jgi:hypothetical protein